MRSGYEEYYDELVFYWTRDNDTPKNITIQLETESHEVLDMPGFLFPIV